MSLVEWLRERQQNAERIAATKRGEDRAGWLEDADYFMAAADAIANAEADAVQAWANVSAEIQRGDDLFDVADRFREALTYYAKRRHYAHDGLVIDTGEIARKALAKNLNSSGQIVRCPPGGSAPESGTETASPTPGPVELGPDVDCKGCGSYGDHYPDCRLALHSALDGLINGLMATVAGVPCRFCMGPGNASGACPDCGKPNPPHEQGGG